MMRLSQKRDSLSCIMKCEMKRKIFYGYVN